MTAASSAGLVKFPSLLGGKWPVEVTVRPVVEALGLWSKLSTARRGPLLRCPRGTPRTPPCASSPLSPGTGRYPRCGRRTPAVRPRPGRTGGASFGSGHCCGPLAQLSPGPLHMPVPVISAAQPVQSPFKFKRCHANVFPHGWDSPASTMPALAVLALGAFVLGTSELAIAGLLPAISADLQVSTGAAGTLVSAYAVAVALLGPGITTMTSHLSRRQVLVGHRLRSLPGTASPLLPRTSRSSWWPGCSQGPPPRCVR